MSDTRGIFLLSELKQEKDLGLGVSLDTVFTQRPSESALEVGYISGGNATPSGVPQFQYTNFEKITYSTSTTGSAPTTCNVPASFPLNTYAGSASSSTAGYMVGGANLSNTFKLTYSDETTALLPGAPFSNPGSNYVQGVSANNHAYFGGGYSGSGVATINRFTFAFDTLVDVPSAHLSVPRTCGATSSTTNGYFGGGYQWPATPQFSSVIDKLVFSTETTARISTADLITARDLGNAVGNNNQGYWIQGMSAVGPTVYTNAVEKLDYSDDTISSAPTATNSVFGSASTGRLSEGYSFGGDDLTPVSMSTADRITYATDTVSPVATANLLVGRSAMTAFGAHDSGSPGVIPSPNIQFSTGNISGPLHGYDAGGGTAGTYTVVNKLTFATDDIVRSPTANLPTGGPYMTSTSTNLAGYYWGGNNFPTLESTVQKIFYSVDASASYPATQLHIGAYGGASFGTIDTGYIALGFVSGFSSFVDKCTYSSDTVALTPGLNLSLPGGYRGYCGNKTQGYFVRSYGAPGGQSDIDKIVYSTETKLRVPALETPNTAYGASGTDTADDGYLCGEMDQPTVQSTTHKLNYGTETMSTLSQAPLSSARYQMSSITSPSSGYYVGGYPGLYYSDRNVDKIDFSTSTMSYQYQALTDGGKSFNSGTSAGQNNINQAPVTTVTSTIFNQLGPNNGYTVGGQFNATQSQVERLDYTTETNFDLPSSYLPPPGRRFLGCAGNSETVYAAGGVTVDTMDKMEYSTETFDSVPATGNMSVARYNLIGLSNNENCYWSGGESGSGTVSNIDKTVISTETTSPLPSTNLADGPRAKFAGAGNPSAGYMHGGYGAGAGPAIHSSTEKLTYSDDTCAALPSQTFQLQAHVALSSPGAVYFSGGQQPSASPENFSNTVKYSYAVELSTLVPSATQIAGGRYRPLGHGNRECGYIQGGEFTPAPLPDELSTTEKLSYSNETISASPSASFLTMARAKAQGAGPRCNGVGPQFPTIC